MNSAMLAEENGLQLVNFGTENGWNEVEANLLGVTGIFSGNMSPAFIQHSIDQYVAAFTQDIDNSQIGKTPKPQTKICADKDGKVVPCDSPERSEGGKSVLGRILEGLYGAGKTIGDVTGNTIDPDYSKSTGDSKLYGDFSLDDIAKRGGYLIVGIALIILAVYLISK